MIFGVPISYFDFRPPPKAPTHPVECMPGLPACHVTAFACVCVWPYEARPCRTPALRPSSLPPSELHFPALLQQRRRIRQRTTSLLQCRCGFIARCCCSRSKRTGAANILLQLTRAKLKKSPSAKRERVTFLSERASEQGCFFVTVRVVSFWPDALIKNC